MRYWKRCPSDTLCGLCSQRVIKKDEAAQYIHLNGVRKDLIRCQDCAGEAPPDLPANMEPGGILPTPTGFSRIGTHAPRRTRGGLKEMIDRFSPHNS